MAAQHASEDNRQFFSVGIVAAAALALILDGVDQHILPLTAPLIIAEWGISRTQMGNALVAVAFGMACGTALGGYLGDRFGRKLLMIVSTTFFGLATAAISFTGNINEITLLRFLGGLAFGAVLPNALALVSTAVPDKWRSTVVAFIVVGVPVGFAIASLMATLLLANIGWRMMFVIGGTASLALAAALPLLLGRVGWKGSANPEQRAANDRVPEADSTRGRRDLLAPGIRSVTIGLWILSFASGYGVFAIINWLPVIVTEAGFSIDDASRATFGYTIATLAGTAIAIAANRLTHPWKVTLCSVVGMIVSGIVVVVIMGTGTQSLPPILVPLMFVSLFGAGVQTNFYVLSALLYPERMRAFGIGAASALNRVGGIVTILIGGAVLEAMGGNPRIFLLQIMAVMTLALIGSILVGRTVTRGLADGDLK